MARFIEVNEIQVEVIRKVGKKTLSLKIDRKTGRPQVSIPWLCPLFIAQKFITEHSVWLQKNIQNTPKKQSFNFGACFSLLDKKLTVQPTLQKRGVFIQDDILFVSGKPEFCHRRVKDFIKAEFYTYASFKAQEYARQTDKKIARITIRDTASRWGSCSGGGGLSFCWRLALAPKFVADYVIAHEVAHLSQMNHSIFFWQQVKKINADTYRAKRWLKENSAYLHSFL